MFFVDIMQLTDHHQHNSLRRGCAIWPQKQLYIVKTVLKNRDRPIIWWPILSIFLNIGISVFLVSDS